jgi:hypothetical protein
MFRNPPVGGVSMTNAAFPFVLPFTPPVFSCVNDEPATSGLTGKPLRSREVSFTVAGEARNDQLAAVLDAANAGTELISDTEGGKWRVGTRSVSYQDGHPVTMHNHRITFMEQEQLTLTAVEIDGMTLTPDRWKILESTNTVVFLASLDSGENRRFNQILERRLSPEAEEAYFPLRLVGVSDTAGSWRFGECLWEGRDDGGARHLVVLVPEAYDAAHPDDGPGLFQPERMRLMHQSVLTKMRLSALIEELRLVGVLDDGAVSRINAKPEKLPFADMREFYRAHNVDEFFS